MKRLGVLGWVAATVVSVWISTQAVAAVRQEVTGPRVPITTVAAPAGDSVATTAPQVGTTGSPSPTSVSPSTTTVSSSSVNPSSNGTATSSAPTTTAPPGTTAVTTTSSPPPTTTATPPRVQTYQLEGGWVRITIGNGTVALDAAAPAVGFTMEIEDGGPDKVEVRFVGDEHESRFEAEWDDGELQVELDEKD